MTAQKGHHSIRVIGSGEGRSLLGNFVVYKLLGSDTDGAFALIEHHLGPRVLGAPLHTHRNEDEASYILQGQVAAQIGDEVITAGPGDLVLKPRGIPHTFWNAGDTPAHLLELIWPAGFVRYFEELDALLASGGPPDVAQIATLANQYDMEMDLESLPLLMEKHGVKLGG